MLSIDVLKDAVSRLFMVRMKLGEFDPPAMNPYTKWVWLYTTYIYIHVYIRISVVLINYNCN